MKMKFITAHFDGLEFNSRELDDFLEKKYVESMQHHFFQCLEKPYLLFIIRYQDQKPYPLPVLNSKDEHESQNWRELLADDALVLFESLRDWRNQRAKEDGVPPYVIAKNRILALISRKKPMGIPALREIEGVGQGTVDKYGGDILAIVRAGVGQEIENQCEGEVENE